MRAFEFAIASVDDDEIERVRARAESFIEVRAPNLTRVAYVSMTPGRLVVAEETTPSVSLAELIFRLRARGPETVVRGLVFVLSDALDGLDSLHRSRLIGPGGAAMDALHLAIDASAITIDATGLSRISRLGTPPITDLAKGTPWLRFAAPEILLRDETAGPRADVYSVGVILWEALMGRPWTDATAPETILSAHLGGEITPASARDLGEKAWPLAEIANRAMATDPSSRYASAGALAAALRATGLGDDVQRSAMAKTIELLLEERENVGASGHPEAARRSSGTRARVELPARIPTQMGFMPAVIEIDGDDDALDAPAGDAQAQDAPGDAPGQAPELLLDATIPWRVRELLDPKLLEREPTDDDDVCAPAEPLEPLEPLEPGDRSAAEALTERAATSTTGPPAPAAALSPTPLPEKPRRRIAGWFAVALLAIVVAATVGAAWRRVQRDRHPPTTRGRLSKQIERDRPPPAAATPPPAAPAAADELPATPNAEPPGRDVPPGSARPRAPKKKQSPTFDPEEI